jgi:WD40 repeat protein
VRLWDAATGAEISGVAAHNFRSSSLSFSPDGRRIASIGGDDLLKIWDVDHLQELLSLRAHDGSVRALAFSPDGNQIATADDQGVIKIWDGSPLVLAPRSSTSGGHREEGRFDRPGDPTRLVPPDG